ncbi:uncharacterized protein [Linepithema humile]|uniref:uncharacterized protein n=1 Tax=Linepithema humile TaxID=83485 RepID=UPI00351E9E99
MLIGGINFYGKIIPLRLRCFIADAPARAFILNHYSHVSRHPCSKCKVSGTRIRGRYVFNGVNHRLRTDDEYIRCSDEEHHKEGSSPLSNLPLGMVSQIPFEYMHLVCLGMMKKLLSAWISGKYSRLSKLSSASISLISARLNTFKKYCPSDFVRHLRPLNMYSKYKATEFRQFLLYTGPVVTYGILEAQIYKHFLLLHASIRILVSNSPSNLHLKFAELALQKFVFRCENLYGSIFNSYNVHGLLHLTNDVKQLGNLDSFSAFPYESNMSIFRKHFRKPGQPLQQFCHRMAEIEAHGTNVNYETESSINVSIHHNSAGDCPQYRKITFNRLSLGVDMRNNCCLLKDGTICIICDIVMDNNSYLLVVKRFQRIEYFYDVGILSSALHIYKCSTLNSEVSHIHLDEVNAKCYRMPFWNSTVDDSSSDEENESETSQYIVATIVHSEKINR